MEIYQLDIDDIPKLQAYFIALGKIYLDNTLGFYPSYEDLRHHFYAEKDHNPDLFIGISQHNQHTGFVYAIQHKNRKTGIIKWLSAKDQQTASHLLLEIENRLRNIGCTKMEYGLSESYLVPGVPEKDIFLRKALRLNGWTERSLLTSLIVEPEKSDPTGESLDKLNLLLPKVSLNHVYEPTPILHKFISTYASTHIAEQVSMALLMNKKSYCSIITREKQIIGCAGVNIYNPNWFGPIIIDPSFRRKGLGTSILIYAMKEAASKHIQQVIIPNAHKLHPFYAHIFDSTKTITFIKTTKVLQS